MVRSYFIGSIGRDGAKVIEGSKGNFMTVDVATDIYSQGENKPMWVRVRSSKPNHLNLAQYLTKGKLIEVVGSELEPRAWNDKEGKPHAQATYVADVINFINTGKKREDGQTEAPAQSAPETKSEMPFPSQAPEDKADDLPF